VNVACMYASTGFITGQSLIVAVGLKHLRVCGSRRGNVSFL